jgi:hypothetical protein
VPRKYTKWESTDLDAFMEYLRSEECGGSAVTMYVRSLCFLFVEAARKKGRRCCFRPLF